MVTQNFIIGCLCYFFALVKSGGAKYWVDMGAVNVCVVYASKLKNFCLF